MGFIGGGDGPHAGQPVLQAGAAVAGARGALILVHGRGGDAAEMLDLGVTLAGPENGGPGIGSPGIACLAPQAAGRVWYPERFIAPVQRNEPFLSSSLSVLAALVESLAAGGIPAGRVVLAGFSQGACLALEFARRRQDRFGAVLGFSGGLIGETITAYAGPPLFDGMPVLLGCSERDAHIPLDRVLQSDAVFAAMGARVTTRIYPGAEHTINADEVALARAMLATAFG